MRVNMLKCKIHRAEVTEANLAYIGSITIDSNLMDAVGLLEYEKVQVVNCNNGERIETYVLRGKPSTGVICMNGAAARKFQPGDKIIVMAYVQLKHKLAMKHKPLVVLINNNDNTDFDLKYK